MKLRCYCCGKPISGQFAIVSMSANETDRVFIMLPDHVENTLDAVSSMLVVPVFEHD